VLVEKSPSNLPDLHAAWAIEYPYSFYAFASGALGWGTPASVGIALGERDTGRNRPIVAMIGDGSLQYSSRYGRPPSIGCRCCWWCCATASTSQAT
jgi:benzoylformate decarboxylase